MAGASDADPVADLLGMMIRDNGKGMDETIVKRVTDPFYTTRTTRPVGLGISLLKEFYELTGGRLVSCSPGKSFELDLAMVQSQLADVALNDPIVMDWLSQIINEQEKIIFGGVLHEIIS